MTQNSMLDAFLGSAADAARAGKPLRVFMGNEASDLDSMASSVLYAFARGALTEGLANVPVMNIPREDFNLRTEAVWLFKEAGINPSNLIFLDDIDLNKVFESGKSRLVMVDHNKLSSAQAAWADWVEEIVDHHADEGLYPAARKHVALVGSASTLVVERILETADRLDPAAATLALGTILLDTVNLDPEAKRATPRDEAAVRKLMALTNADRATLFDRLQFEKFNVAALSTRDILRKDYKEYRMGSLLCGMSSALLPLADWFKKDTALEASLSHYAESRKLDILIVMNAYTAPDFTREMAVYSKDAALRRRTIAFMNSAGLGLVPLKAAANVPAGDTEYFSQGDLGQSRKKLQPLLSDYLS